MQEDQAPIRIRINGAVRTLSVAPEMPLLWVLRDELGLVGTKYGCGIGLCGACTVLVDGRPVTSCSLAAGDVSGDVTTIEALAGSETLHPVQDAWIDAQVAQCGYCQPGQILAAVALLTDHPDATDEEIDSALAGHICRCGTYGRIRAAIRTAARAAATAGPGPAPDGRGRG